MTTKTTTAAPSPVAGGSRKTRSSISRKGAVSDGARAPTKVAIEKPTKVSTPWGISILVDEVRVEQGAGDKQFTTLVQMLESEHGEQLVRVAYSTGGVARRGPVTLRAKDVGELRSGLERCPALASLLGLQVTRERVSKEREESLNAG